MIMMQKLTQTAATLALLALLPVSAVAQDLEAEMARREQEANAFKLAVSKIILGSIEEVEVENGLTPLSRETEAATGEFSAEEEFLALTEKMPMPKGVERDTSIAFVPAHLCESDPDDPSATQRWTSLSDPDRQTARLRGLLQDRNVLRTGDCSCAGKAIPWAMARNVYDLIGAVTANEGEGVIIDFENAYYKTMKQFCGER